MRERICAIFVVAILFLSFMLLLPTFKFTYSDAIDRTALSRDKAELMSDAISDYLDFSRGSLYLSYDNESVFDAQELFHMAEVRHIFKNMLYIDILCFIFFIFMFFKTKNKRDIFKKQFKYTLFISISFIIISMLSFSKGFEVMHRIIFDNDMWLFSPTSNLIMLLDENFFKYFFIKYILIVLIFSYILRASGGIYGKFIPRKR